MPLLVILAVIWAAVLIPPLVRSRAERSNDSIGDFNHRLDVLGQTNGALRVRSIRSRRAPLRRNPTKRRRDVLRVLAAGVVLTGALGLATNMRAAWALNVIADLAFGAFLVLWAYARSLSADRALKVRALAPRRHPSQLPLRRAASS